MVQVRESSRFGFCYALGELIGETAIRYIYRNRTGMPSSAALTVQLRCMAAATVSE